MRQLVKIMDEILEALSPTERTKRYNKKHPKKVKAHLRKTTEDRVERNRARREKTKKYGKQKMKNRDVHHPDGTDNKHTRVVKANHGPDKK